MNKPAVPIRRIVLGKDVRGFDLTRRILKRIDGLPIDEDPPYAIRNECPDPAEPGKDTLHLSVFPGELLKPCPGTQGYICCGYRILHVGTNCPLDCTYCILQAYLNQPYLRVFVNLEERLPHIGEELDAQPGKVFRLGTGEFTDSLALDPVVGWTEVLLPFFKARRNAVLELKTKTVSVERLLRSGFRDRIVVSWSLNSTRIASREEHGAPSIRKRLGAAKRVQEEGYVVGFHFDPLIYHPGWREGYLRTIDMLERYIDPRGVIWISLGSFRYMPQLKTVIRKRHPASRILEGEFIPGLDGKMRYFKPIRTEMYSFMAEALGAWHDELGVYLCMESADVWKDSLGWTPAAGSAGLAEYLDTRAIRFFDMQ
ncbi:MAG: DNA photolyase [Deltaproteobacteria bacterium]|nr:DNA photolyase [Deltaproteobacteria bacterium]